MNEWIWQSDGDDSARQNEIEKSLYALVYGQMNGANFRWKTEEEKMKKLTI